MSTCPPHIKINKNIQHHEDHGWKGIEELHDIKLQQHREFQFGPMNSVLHNNGHEVVYSSIERLLLDMHDMHIPSRNILKVMKFQKRLTIN
jgi:hypothetical protein